MTQVFFSYAREDIDIVRKLAKDLEKAGFETWWDVSALKGGDVWVRTIQEAIKASEYCFIVLSPNSTRSEWVQKEYTYAIGLGLKIIPILYKTCEVPMALANLQWIDFRSKYDRGLRELLIAFQALPHAIVPSPARPRRPVNWENVGAIVGLIGVLIALGAWLVPNAADFLFAWLSETPTVIPTSSPTHTPTISTTTPIDTPFPPTTTPTFTLVPLADTPVPPTDTPTPTPTRKAVELPTGNIAVPVYRDNQKHIYLAGLDGVELTLKRLTRDASEPALSPDGSQIAFRSWNDATRGLIVMNVNDTYPRRVSRSLEDACPYWAQGESLVFHSIKEGPTPRLYTVGTWEGAEMVDSVQGVLRGTDPAYGQYPAWVPDGRIVYKYFERTGNFLGLHIMNLDGSNPMPITDHPGDTMPSVSPRGDKVAFMSDRSGHWEVYTVNINGSGLRQLTDSGGYNSGLPTWSPDGHYIAFVSDRGNQWAIWVMKSDSSGERKLFDLDGTLTWAERISWAP